MNRPTDPMLRVRSCDCGGATLAALTCDTCSDAERERQLYEEANSVPLWELVVVVLVVFTFVWVLRAGVAP